jgi:hypothetical protein
MYPNKTPVAGIAITLTGLFLMAAAVVAGEAYDPMARGLPDIIVNLAR